MPLLYEQLTQRGMYLLKGKLQRPLTIRELERLHNCRSLMEQKADVYIHEITTSPEAVSIYFSPKTEGFFVISMSIITTIAVIASAVGLPIMAWLLLQPPEPGPGGLPQWFWVGVGIAIPIFGLGVLVYTMKR